MGPSRPPRTLSVRCDLLQSRKFFFPLQLSPSVTLRYRATSLFEFPRHGHRSVGPPPLDSTTFFFPSQQHFTQEFVCQPPHSSFSLSQHAVFARSPLEWLCIFPVEECLVGGESFPGKRVFYSLSDGRRDRGAPLWLRFAFLIAMKGRWGKVGSWFVILLFFFSFVNFFLFFLLFCPLVIVWQKVFFVF